MNNFETELGYMDDDSLVKAFTEINEQKITGKIGPKLGQLKELRWKFLREDNMEGLIFDVNKELARRFVQLQLKNRR